MVLAAPGHAPARAFALQRLDTRSHAQHRAGAARCGKVVLVHRGHVDVGALGFPRANSPVGAQAGDDAIKPFTPDQFDPRTHGQIFRNEGFSLGVLFAAADVQAPAR